jgi:hypothetical protein
MSAIRILVDDRDMPAPRSTTLLRPYPRIRVREADVGAEFFDHEQTRRPREDQHASFGSVPLWKCTQVRCPLLPKLPTEPALAFLYPPLNCPPPSRYFRKFSLIQAGGEYTLRRWANSNLSKVRTTP